MRSDHCLTFFVQSLNFFGQNIKQSGYILFAQGHVHEFNLTVCVCVCVLVYNVLPRYKPKIFIFGHSLINVLSG